MRSEEEIRERIALRESAGFESSAIYAIILELKWVLEEE